MEELEKKKSKKYPKIKRNKIGDKILWSMEHQHEDSIIGTD